MTTAPSWRSETGRRAYFAAYDANLARWPVAVESFDVDTSFGPTHVNACGAKDAPPLVLLHGFGFSSTMWHANVAALAARFRVYAVDTIGDAGRSVLTRPIADRRLLADWLCEVYDRLGIDRPDVVGMSFGGFVAATLAIHRPARAGRVVLISPAAVFVPIVWQFFARGMAMGLLRWRWLADGMMSWIMGATSKTDPLVEQFALGIRHFHGSLRVYPSAYTDAELRIIPSPVLLLIGEREVIYDPARVVARARATLGSVEAEIVPGATHGLSMDQPRLVEDRIVRFLASAEPRGVRAAAQPERVVHHV